MPMCLDPWSSVAVRMPNACYTMAHKEATDASEWRRYDGKIVERQPWRRSRDVAPELRLSLTTGLELFHCCKLEAARGEHACFHTTVFQRCSFANGYDTKKLQTGSSYTTFCGHMKRVLLKCSTSTKCRAGQEVILMKSANVSCKFAQLQRLDSHRWWLSWAR
jgi:hypothetical protein